MIKTLASAALLSALLSTAAYAQSDEPAAKEPRRIRIGLGARAIPQFPGATDHAVVPYFDADFTRGDKPFTFESPDESFGFPLLKAGAFEFGPTAALEGSRKRKETGVAMDEIGTTIEVGAFAQVWLGDAIRIRAEGRRGIGGHKAWVGSVAADFVARDGDKYVFSIGPRVALSDSDYESAYFGVNTREATATGLPYYRPKSGAHAAGVASGLTVSLTERWGVMTYAKYDRLIGDAADSPFIRAYGKRDQFSGGLGLTYTFRVR